MEDIFELDDVLNSDSGGPSLPSIFLKTLLGLKVIGADLLILPKLDKSPGLGGRRGGPTTCSSNWLLKLPRPELLQAMAICRWQASFSALALSFAT
jgi:hypothetical protein